MIYKKKKIVFTYYKNLNMVKDEFDYVSPREDKPS